MRGDGSAYAALGLEPDADWADIERAYKRLIKRYHPDRQGGDPARAAEINRAYRELRGPPDPNEALVLHQEEPADAQRGWVNAAMALVIALAALLIATGPVAVLMRQLSPRPPHELDRVAGLAGVSDVMDQPLHRAAISGGMRDALRIAGRHDELALVNASRECHRTLRLQPSLDQLDRCAAFDDAVVELQNRDPMWDRGPFSQIAVTGRQWSAASTLSNDYLAVDSRLDRIRLQVELALAAPPPRPEAPAN